MIIMCVYVSVHECEGCIAVHFVYANKIAHSNLSVLPLSAVIRAAPALGAVIVGGGVVVIFDVVSVFAAALL